MIETGSYTKRRIKALADYSILIMAKTDIAHPSIELQLTNNNYGSTFSSQAGSNLKLCYFLFLSWIQ